MHHVQRSLVAGTIRKNALTIDMATDVFKFLFDGKGVDANSIEATKNIHWRTSIPRYFFRSGTCRRTRMVTDVLLIFSSE